MNNPCIGPDGKRYIFVVKKPDETWWVSPKLFVISVVDDGYITGQYIRDMWYMETIKGTDLMREFMIIPIDKNMRINDIKLAIATLEKTNVSINIPQVLRESYGIKWIYKFVLTSDTVNKYIEDEKLNESFSLELHPTGDEIGPNGSSYMQLVLQARLLLVETSETKTKGLHISNPEFATY
jgi:hypothetical protein